MADDQKAKLKEHLVREIDAVMKLARPFQQALKALNAEDDSPPWTSRFSNMPTVNAVLKYLTEEVREGATGPEILEALSLGGAAYNQPHFERDLKNSLGRASKSGVLIKHGEKYLPGKKRPANLMNRHGRKPLK
jgi:hypothetical protein